MLVFEDQSDLLIREYADLSGRLSFTAPGPVYITAGLLTPLFTGFQTGTEDQYR